MRIAPRSIARSVARNIWEPLEQGINDSIGGSAVLPAGAIGIYYPSNYSASPRKMVVNSATQVAASQNLLSMPRRVFNNTFYWGKFSITVTDRNALCNDGITLEASTLIGTGDCYIFPATAPVLPAGTYTMAAWVKRSGGSDSNFVMEFSTAGSASPTKTATGTWQRFSHTAVCGAGAQTMFFARAVAAAGFSLEVYDLALYAGAADLGEPALAGHMYMMKNQYQTGPVAGSGGLDFSNSSYGEIQFPATTFNTYTIIAVGRKKTNVQTYNAIISNLGAYITLTPMFEQANTAHVYYGGQDIASGGLTTAWKMHTRGWKMHASRYDGTSASVFVNKSRVMHQTGYTPTAVTLRELMVAAFQDPSSTTDMEHAALVIWNRALSESEMATAYDVIKANILTAGITLTEDDYYWRAEGDSITNDGNSYCLKYGTNSTLRLLGSRSATNGGTVAGLVARAAELNAGMVVPFGSRKYILSILIGANDLSGGATTAQFLTDLAAYCDSMRAVGRIVVLCTLLPNTNVGYNAKRNVANTEIRLWTTGGSSNPGIHADYIVDFAADATMGPDAAASDPSLYPDGVHPSNTGHIALEIPFRAVMNSIP